MANRYLSPDCILNIRRRAEAGQEPVTQAYRQLLADADAALNQPPLSVRDNGGSPHFRQDAVYLEGKDGQKNPEANMKSSELALKLVAAALPLALAWRFTGENRYADKALELIHTWTINQNTLMFPEGRVVDAHTPGAIYGGDIILFISFHDLFLACYLLADYPGWNLPALAAVKRWTKTLIEAQRPLMFFGGTPMYNNWEDARLLFLVKAALFLDDTELLLTVFDRWRQTLPIKMTPEGEFPRETMRTRSMNYTLFALHSSLEIAEIARQHGIDLFDYTVNGRNIKMAADYAAPYLLNMEKWPHQMITPLADERGHFAAFEIAYARWQDPRYLEVLNAWGGRPISHGYATLLHA